MKTGTSSSFWRNRWVILNLILLTVVTGHSLWRDMRMESGYYATDLRNRVVGARLQKDGRLPYYYHWEDEGILRYADPLSRGNSGANAITASPFFHELLMPVCDLPEKQIEQGWLVFSWLLLAGMIALFFRMCNTNPNRLLVLNTGILFTLTEGWKMHIYAGQLYIFIAFLMSLLTWFLVRKSKNGWPAGGLVMAVLILCRPIALVVGLPFLPVLRSYRKYFAVTALLLLAYGIYAYTVPFERSVWTEYRKALSAHVAFHQAGTFVPNRTVRPDRPLDTMEGIHLAEIDTKHSGEQTPFYTENGNIFTIYQLISRHRMPLWLLNGLLVLFLVAIEIRWLQRTAGSGQPVWSFAVLGWTLYMIVEIFSPVHRNQYNTVEWLPVLLSFAAFLNLRRLSPALILIAAGMFLNISNTHLIPMRHTIGEFCWLTAGLCLLLPERKIAAN